MRPLGYVSGNTASRGRTSPTQELVDAFTTIKGLSINEDIKSATNATGYDANNPYANRDPRLALTVFTMVCPGLQDRWKHTTRSDRPGGVTVQTKTGYYICASFREL